MIIMVMTGKSRLAGNAATNCTIGCTLAAILGLKPIHTPMGTQIIDDIIIKLITLAPVKRPSTATCPASLKETLENTNFQMANDESAITSAINKYGALSMKMRGLLFLGGFIFIFNGLILISRSVNLLS